MTPLHLKFRATVNEYRRLSLDAWTRDICITPLKDTEYNIVSPDHPNAATFQININVKKNRHLLVDCDPTNDQLVVLRDNTWLPMLTYLKRLHPPRSDNARVSKIRHPPATQAYWWQENGKHFPLLDLPLETREAIYFAALGPSFDPQGEADTFNRNLYYCNKQVYIECRRVVKHDLSVHVNLASRAECRLTRNICSSIGIHNLQIDLDHQTIRRLYAFTNLTETAFKSMPRERVRVSAKVSNELSITIRIGPPESPWLSVTNCFELQLDHILQVLRRAFAGRNVRIVGYVTQAQKDTFDKDMQIAWRAQNDEHKEKNTRHDFFTAIMNASEACVIEKRRLVAADKSEDPSEDEVKSWSPWSLTCKCEVRCKDFRKWQFRA